MTKSILVLTGRVGCSEVWFIQWFRSTKDSGMLKVIHVLICSSITAIVDLETTCIVQTHALFACKEGKKKFMCVLIKE